MDSRMGNFASGASEPQSLQLRASNFNNQVHRSFTANGLNQPIMLDPSNGNSRMDSSRQTPNGQLPSRNGMSDSTYNTINPTSFGMKLDI